MASNPVPPRSLVIVKASVEDPHSQLIQSRMGMSVVDFMEALTDPHSRTLDAIGLSRAHFVWPKHTNNEVCDPSTLTDDSIHDASWSLRFRALGCYHPLIDKTAKSSKLKRAPRTPPILSQDVSAEVNVQKDKPNSLSNVDEKRRHLLLMSRSSINSSVSLPSETITAAQHHQLEEDLKLSDSGDENEEGEDMDATKPMLEANSESDLAPYSVNETGRSPSKRKMLTPDDRPVVGDVCTVLPRIMTIDNALTQFSQSIPPFVSPLSCMGDGAMECDAPDTTCFVNEVVVHTEPETATDALVEPGDKPTTENFLSNT
ncbi:uncharacterized protein DEA37_0012727 [Paragonimus westermani]|uniref:Uncharacterized protein n=1 Tax=Paragonimus westermani TaxID=34504 RepID=A0A5J4P2J2_9TREM|nr:uncharacterized protein DEA37_0012727 [Paragonimus westermani]